MLRPLTSRYVVKRGDCLWNIARKQYGDPTVWPAISEANHLPRPPLLAIGLPLRLPIIHDPRRYRAHPHRQALATPYPLAGPACWPDPLAQRMSADTAVSSSPVPAESAPPLEALTPARQVRFPAFKLRLDSMRPIVLQDCPPVEVRFTGEVTFQRKDALTEIELGTSGGRALSFKSQVENQYNRLAIVDKFRYDVTTGRFEMSAGFSVAAKLNGQVLATAQMTLISSNRVRFTYKPREIQGEHDGFLFKGTLGFEATLTLDAECGPPRFPVPVKVPESSFDWVRAAQYTLVAVAVGGAIVLAPEIIAIGATAGTSAETASIAFGAAATLLQRTAQFVH